LLTPVTLLKGFITFDGAYKEERNIHITVVEDESGRVVQDIKPNSKTGKYIVVLNGGITGKKYTVKYEADGYKPIVETLTIEPGSSYQEISKEVDLKLVNFESKVPGTLSISGIVKNTNKEIVPNVNVIVKDNQSGESVGSFFTDKTSGKYYFVLQPGRNYNISYDAAGYLFHSENINIPKQPEYKEISKDVTLERIAKGSTSILNNIFFDSNKSLLRKESNVELEKVFKFLKDNANIKVEVSGHTDSKGKDAANLKLSKDRAQSVVNYLIQKGIDKNRIIAKGYGKTLPIAPNTTADGKPNKEGMQLNRRVELKIIE
jgi:outer membrane protein OmpA-like peptidoglycan-associated protein